MSELKKTNYGLLYPTPCRNLIPLATQNPSNLSKLLRSVSLSPMVSRLLLSTISLSYLAISCIACMWCSSPSACTGFICPKKYPLMTRLWNPAIPVLCYRSFMFYSILLQSMSVRRNSPGLTVSLHIYHGNYVSVATHSLC